MGRARKPIELQKKHLTEKERLEKEQAEAVVTVGREQLSRPPNWLVDKVAKKEFKRICKEFEKINVVGNLDLNNIAGYCNAYSFYRRITKELADMDPIVLEDENNPNSKKILNEIYQELSKNQRNYAEEMRKFASLCGLTIDSRLKVGGAQVSKTNKEIETEFGDI